MRSFTRQFWASPAVSHCISSMLLRLVMHARQHVCVIYFDPPAKKGQINFILQTGIRDSKVYVCSYATILVRIWGF